MLSFVTVFVDNYLSMLSVWLYELYRKGKFYDQNKHI